MDFGLSFASAHLVHLGLVARLYYVSPSPLPQSSLIYFGIAAIFTYVLAILSVKRLSARLNPTVWRTVRTLGVEYIALVFLTDFAKNSRYRVGLVPSPGLEPGHLDHRA